MMSKEKKKPLLSICIPTFNRMDIVYECVNKCLAYDVEWIEVCVTDNCSTDNTKEKLCQISDKRFSYHRNERNIGYENLAMCMKNAAGRWCLLLSDEDELYDVNWVGMYNLLLNEKDATIFQFEYFDNNGEHLLYGPKSVMSKDSYETYQFCKTQFAYAGGTILRHETVVNVWDRVLHDNLLWNLYSEVLIPMWCSYYGSLKKMLFIKARRSDRDGKGKLDKKAWNGNCSEPYWSMKSRDEQNRSWYLRIKELPCSDNCKYHLLLQHRLDSIYSIYIHYCNIHNPKLLQSPLFFKRWDIVENDQKNKLKDWLYLLLKKRKEMNYCFRCYTSDMAKYQKMKFLYDIKQANMIICVALKLIIKEIILSIKGKVAG